MLRVDLPIDIQVTSELSPNNCWTKTIGCVHQTRPKKRTRHSATCYARTYWSPYLSWCQAAWLPCQDWNFSSSCMNCMSMDSIIEVFYHLNIMIIATKHIAYNNLVFQYKTAHWHILYATQTRPLYFTFSDLWPQEPRYDWWTPLIIRFRESYNSINMSSD